MSFLSGLFAEKDKTKQQSQQESTTQNNLWGDPALQNYFGNWQTQFSPGSISQVQAPANAFMYNAANYQPSLASNLSPAFDTTGQITQTGLSPTAYMPYMSPYTQNVVDKTIASYGNLDAQAFENMNSKRAAQSSLGNNTGGRGEALYYQAVNPQREAQIAGLYDKGYTDAVDNAARSAGIQLQGAGAQGALAGAQSNINQGAFNMGEGIRQADVQNQMLPFQLYSQGLQGFGGFGNLAGSTSSGTSSGTSTTTSSPGIMQSIMGLAGTAAKGFGFGQGMGWWRDGGRVPARSNGGAIFAYTPSQPTNDDVLTRMGNAFAKLQEIGRAAGGSVADVGATEELRYPSASDFGALFKQSGIAEDEKQRRPQSAQFLNQAQSDLSRFMAANQQPQQQFAAGGEVDEVPSLGSFTNTADQPEMDLSWRGEPVPGFAMPKVAQGAPEQAAPQAPMAGIGGGGMGQPPEQPQGSGPPQPPTPQTYRSNAWDALGNALLAGSGPKVLGHMGKAFMQQEQDKVAQFYKDQQARMEQYNAQVRAGELARQARQWQAEHGLRMQQMAETKRANDPTIALRQRELLEKENPEVIYNQREVLADRLGLAPGSRERNEFIATGDFPKASATKDSLLMQAAEREQLAVKLGLVPGSPAFQTFVATGRMGRDETLSATDRKAIQEAVKEVSDFDVAIKQLDRAIELNAKAKEGALASARAAVQNLTPYTATESSKATRELSDLLSADAIKQMSETLKGASTDREMFKFIEMAGDVSLPSDLRLQYLQRAKNKLVAHRKTAQTMADEIRGGTFYKPKGAELPIGRMTMEELRGLDRKSLSPEELQEASRRYNELVATEAPLP